MTTSEQAPPPRAQRTNPLAIAALVCGIVLLIGLFIAATVCGIVLVIGPVTAALACGIAQFIGLCPVGIVAIILGRKARRQIGQTGENGYALAKAGLVLGRTGIALAIAGLVVPLLIVLIGLTSGPVPSGH